MFNVDGHYQGVALDTHLLSNFNTMTAKNKLALTKTMLEQPQRLTDVFELEPFQHNFVKNYAATTGKEDGLMVWEREKVLFMKKISSDKNLEKCTRLSIYSSFIELAVSGLTLNDDQAYIIPYKGVATFQIGWRGRLEQISRLDHISEVGLPQVVYESDDFDYELGGLSAKILKHKRTNHDHGKDDIITHVYLIYKTTDGREHCIIMERHEVLAIRDNFSESYKYYIKNNGKGKSADGRTWDLDPPMWITHEAEAFKKTIVKRLYKGIPKTGRMRVLDEKVSQYPDHEDGTMNIEYGVVIDDEETSSDVQQPSINNGVDLGDENESF